MIATTSLSPMNPHLGHFSILPPISLSLLLHPSLGHIDDVFLALTFVVSSLLSNAS
ncbi:MAG: hypothetical protein QXG74_01790 [Acidilobaceae archaeon]